MPDGGALPHRADLSKLQFLGQLPSEWVLPRHGDYLRLMSPHSGVVGDPAGGKITSYVVTHIVMDPSLGMSTVLVDHDGSCELAR